MKKIALVCAMLFAFFCNSIHAQMLGTERYDKFYPGKLWFDTDGQIINAHGGGILLHEGTYYWFGEHKGERSNAALVGVTCYSSTDLYNWNNLGVAFAVSDEPGSPVERGCTLERPKVIYNKKTGKFVMFFHLELKGQGYNRANVGVAVADKPEGPYTFLKNGRVNPGKWPKNLDKTFKNKQFDKNHKGWSEEWKQDVSEGMMVQRDLEGGQMSRDMQLYVDNDGKAYHIYSSEDNLTIQIAELTDDYLDYTGKYIRIDPAGHNEAPALFKKDGKYFMITSGCTGWAPNAARLLTADNIMGHWTRHDNPCRGKGADKTFNSQSTYILPLPNGKFIFMADRWMPSNPIDGRYVWLPIEWEDGMPILKWHDQWKIEE